MKGGGGIDTVVVLSATQMNLFSVDMNSQPNSDTGKSPYSRVFERTIGMPDSGEPAEPLRDFALGG